MSDIKSALIQYNQAMDALDKAEQAVQDALLNIKSTAQSSTVEVDGQFFQVRERREKLYLCELNGKPKGRPLGSKNTKPRRGSRAAEAAALETEDLPQAEPQTEPVENTGVHVIDAESVSQMTAETATA